MKEHSTIVFLISNVVYDDFLVLTLIQLIYGKNKNPKGQHSSLYCTILLILQYVTFFYGGNVQNQ